MRRATLYTLQATDIMAGDYHRLVRSNLRPHFTASPDVAIAPINFEHFAVPIHRVRRCVKPKTEPLYADPFSYEVEEFYLALEPALAEMLEAPFKEQAETAKMKRDEIWQGFNRLITLITVFESEPWWRRVWLALTGKAFPHLPEVKNG